MPDVNPDALRIRSLTRPELDMLVDWAAVTTFELG
jgi:hypothetical protein